METMDGLEMWEEALRWQITGECLAAATGDVVALRVRPELQEEWPVLSLGEELREPVDVSRVRQQARCLCARASVEEDRREEFAVAVSEAASNALLHGGGGRACLGLRDGVVRCRIEDGGPGIPITALPNAVLRKGWSSGRSLGMGFSLMIAGCTRVLLATDRRGTLLLLELSVRPPEPDYLAALAIEL